MKGNSNEKKHFIFNWQFTVGLLLFNVTLIVNRFIELPDFFRGFAEGFSIVLTIYGLLAATVKYICNLIKQSKKTA